jgi:hypothetical protein
MTILKCKGTKLQHEVATVLTDIAQLISLDGPDAEVETFEADTLDNANAGIPMKPTGRSAGGSVSFEMFLDPALAGHQLLTDRITTPVSDSWAIVFSDATAWPFEGILKSLSPTVDLADGLKASGEVELDGIVTYP